MNKVIISNRQLALTVSGFMFGSAPLLIAGSVASLAGRDAWLSAILTVIIGLAFIWIYTGLGGLYPDKTLVEVIQLLLGKWIGAIASSFLILIALNTASQVVWYAGDFITTVYMPEVPAYPIKILFTAVLAIALLYGLEAIFRAAEMLFITLFPFYIISMALLTPNIKGGNLLPVLEDGIIPVLKGTVPLLSLTVLPLIFLNMVFPVNLADPKKAKKSMFKGFFLGIVTVHISVIMCILVLGSNVTANLRFPLFWITKEIKIGAILSRIEAVVLFVWLAANFISAYFYFYAGVTGLSQMLKLNSNRRIILPLALIIAVFSGFTYWNVPYEIRWDALVWPPAIFTVGFVLPVILLIAHMIRKWLRKKWAQS